jgi:hypothetical protein
MEIPDEKTQAHMAISRTDNGKLLSWEEKDVVADALVSGKTSQLKSPQMREALVEALVSLGVTSDYLAKKIREGLEATDEKFFAHEGVVQDSREVVSWQNRHGYLRTALKLLGVEGRGGVKINARNFVYKPMLRGGGETIVIEPPKETVLKRRMAAAKANARKVPDGE